MMHVHKLTGCAPAPLAHYLKALGILRVVAQQVDPEARGFWKNEHFHLVTALDRDALERFFLDLYAPTPLVSPWNKGSGFYADEDPGLAPLEASLGPRFAGYRSAIEASRGQLDAISKADAEVRRLKDSTKKKKGMSPKEAAAAEALKSDPDLKARLAAAEREFKRLKADLFAPFARAWRGGVRDWMDAAMVLGADGKPSWPSLLGTGGNDGRLDFTNNAMQRLGDLFDLASVDGAPAQDAAKLLRNSLWALASTAVAVASVGQFMPGNAGGANGSTGPDAEPRVNAWDFVLLLEGAVLFRGHTTRVLSGGKSGRASVPFALHAQAVGHATPGLEGAERGEQWMPIWEHAATFGDVESLLAEGRAQLDRRAVDRPLDFARAVGRLGVARGVRAFQRFGYLERNGQSKMAVPLGRVVVTARASSRLIDEVASWLDRLEREARDGKAGARFEIAHARLADAVFDVLTRSETPERWQQVLLGAARMEALQAAGTAFARGPMPRLSEGWLEAARDDSAEWRLAVALGSACGAYEHGRASDPVRAHVLPLDRSCSKFATTSDKRLVSDARVVFTGRDAAADLMALVQRRVVEAAQHGQRTLSLVAAGGAGASPEDLGMLLAGQVDLARVVWLARALMAIRWERVRNSRLTLSSSLRGLDEAWQAIRLCALPFDLAGRRVPLDAGILRRLESGDASSAVSIALRRLRSAGFQPPIVTGTASPEAARLWLSALAFPIDIAVAEAMASRFESHAMTETA